MNTSYNVPELQNCCGCLRLRIGAFLISIVAVVSGCFGLTAIVIYGLAEQNILSSFLQGRMYGPLRKITIPVLVITSSMLTVTGWLTLFGTFRRSKAILTWSICTMVVMCHVVLVAVVSVPLSCFLSPHCIMNGVPVALLTLLFILITLFLVLWFYFVLVVYSYRREIAY